MATMRPLRLRFTLVVSGGILLVLQLLRQDNEAALWLQFVLGKWAYSTSNGAAIFLLIFGVLCVWRLYCSAAVTLATDHVPSNRSAALAFMLLACALVLGHGINLWLTLRYLHEMQIPLGMHVYHWDMEAYSFTGLFHSHLGKTAFAVVAQALDWRGNQYDGGGVFLPWVPQWAAWFIGGCFVLGCGAVIAALPALARARSAAQVAVFALAGLLRKLCKTPLPPC